MKGPAEEHKGTCPRSPIFHSQLINSVADIIISPLLMVLVGLGAVTLELTGLKANNKDHVELQVKLHLYTFSHCYLPTCSNPTGSGWEGDNLTALCPPG